MTDFERKQLERTAPLLRQIVELSLEIFEHVEPVITDETAKLRLRTLAGTMRKVIAMSKGESVLIQGEKHG